MIADAVVIGGGFAGLTAAVRLSSAGLKVVVAEEAPRLGGRAAAFTDRETGERVDNGQHVLFGCYHETYAFLKTLGTEDLAPLETRLTLAMAGSEGRPSTLSCPSWPPPWHLVGGVLAWRALPLRDRLSAFKMAGVIGRARRSGAAAVAERTPASQTVSDWLTAHGQSAALCRWLWHPLAVAALNQSPDTAAARPFVRVLGEMFGPRAEDSAIGLPRVPLDELYAEPARQFVERRGGNVLTRSPASVGMDASSRIIHVRAGGESIETSRVVSAVPWHALGRIWEPGVPPALTDVASRAARMVSSPIVTVNLWLDRPVMPQRFVGLIGGSMQWAFDKSAIFGGEAGHISMVSSGASALVNLTNEELGAVAIRDLRSALPAARAAVVRRAVAVREHRATFSLAPSEPPRPGTTTPLAGFYLAGDWIDTGLPGTIESAVLSGRLAADALLRDAGGAPPPAPLVP